MDMEQRVKTLEQEMKILKNQVQKTLLDIQEQILIHYHPALRAEDETFTESSGAGRETARSTNGRHAVEADTTPEPGLKVRQVSLADLRQPAQPDTRPFSATSTPPDSDPAFAGLADWVGESVSKIGAERTRKLLDLRAANGGMPPELHDTLHELITLCAGDEGTGAAETAVLLQQLSRLLK